MGYFYTYKGLFSANSYIIAFVYIRSLSKYANGKITALHEILYGRGRLGGSVGKSWTCHFR